jgi:hypothetical protein
LTTAAKPTPALDSLRERLDSFQQQLLDEICEPFLTAEDGIGCRALHFKHENVDGVIDALNRLGGTVVYEREDHQVGNRYQPTLLGLLLSGRGRSHQALLARYLDFVQKQLRVDPHVIEFDSGKIEAALQLPPSESRLLCRLLRVNHGFCGNMQWSGAGAEWKWAAGVMRNAEELLRWPDKSSFVADSAMRSYDPSTPVDIQARRAYASSQHKAHSEGNAEPTNHFEEWKKRLYARPWIAGLAIAFTVIAAIIGLIVQIRQAFDL